MPSKKPRSLDDDWKKQTEITDDELDRMMAGSFGGAGPQSATPESGSVSSFDELEVGTDVRGRITSIDDEVGEVYIELGKDVGVVGIGEFVGTAPRVGDEVIATVKKYEKREEHYRLSVSEHLKQAFIDAAKVGDVVEIRVVETNRGGLVGLTHGQRVFVPISQIDLVRVEDTKSYVDQKFEVEITQIDGGRGEIVGSRRKVLEADRQKIAAVKIRSLRVGESIVGTVARVASPGVFIDLGGIDGLLPRRELQSLGKNDSDFEVGRTVDVEITSVDVAERRVGLSLSRSGLDAEAFDEAAGEYVEGEKITALVSRVRDEGAYLFLEDNLEGFLPADQIRANPVRPGQLVDAVVVKIDTTTRRVTLKR